MKNKLFKNTESQTDLFADIQRWHFEEQGGLLLFDKVEFITKETGVFEALVTYELA